MQGNGHICILINMKLEHLSQIHPEDFITGEDQDVFRSPPKKILHITPDSIGSPLVPVHILIALTCSLKAHKTTVKRIKLVCRGNVLVQRARIELGQDVNAVESGIDAVADRDINQSEFSGNRHRGLGTIFRQGPQPRSATATEDHGYCRLCELTGDIRQSDEPLPPLS